jgi:hypothetical protein
MRCKSSGDPAMNDQGGNPASNAGGAAIAPTACVIDPGGATPNQISDWSVHWNFLTETTNKFKKVNESEKADNSCDTPSDSLEHSEKRDERKHQPKKDWKLFPVELLEGSVHSSFGCGPTSSWWWWFSFVVALDCCLLPNLIVSSPRSTH